MTGEETTFHARRGNNYVYNVDRFMVTFADVPEVTSVGGANDLEI